MSLRLLPALALALLVAGCQGDDPVEPAEVYQLAMQGGDEQSGPGGSVLAEPLQVLVKGPTGTPVRGVTVAFEPAAGSGVVLSDTRVTSGIDGVARVDARVGTTEAERVEIARAFLVGNTKEEVRFYATIAPPPTLVSVSPATVRPGDTVLLTGTNFNQSVVGNAVYFGLSRAHVFGGTGTTELRVVVPPCITAGTVQVRVQVGSASTNEVPVSYVAQQSTIALQLYDGITVSGAELQTCLRLEGDSARYLVVPQFATASVPLDPIGYTLGNTNSTPSLLASVSSPNREGNSMQVRLDYRLRALERDLAVEARAYASSRPPGLSLEALSLNSVRNFRVLSNLPGPNEQAEFKTASAQLKYIGSNILLYVDQTGSSGSGAYTQDELDALGRLFDDELYELGVTSFGTESDIDRNDKVIVLFTPIVNGLTPAPCSQGFVTGFFFGYDLTSGRDSNKGEIFYALVPDPNAQFSCAHSKTQVGRIVPGTFIHEFQHMISYNQHALVRGGSPETLWLNEGLSHIAEELAAKHYEAKYPAVPPRIFSDTAQDFIIGNLFNSYDWLTNTAGTSVLASDDESYGTLEERGAAWLFLRWLGDQHGDGIYGRLVQTRRTSVENIEDRTGESFQRLFGDFSIALWTDSIPGVPREAVALRYRFQSRNLRQLYNALYNATQGTSTPLPRPFPLEPASLPAGGSVTKTMLPGTMAHYILQTPKPSTDVALQFSKPTSQCGTGAACLFGPDFKAQVSVFRLPPP